MKMSKRDGQNLLALLGVVAIVAVYFGIYTPYQEKTDALKSENAQLTQQVRELEVYEAEVEKFEAETKDMIEDVNDIFERFPSDSEAEDAIMYAVDLEEQDETTKISSIGLSSTQVMYEAAPCSISLKSAKDEGEERIYRLNREQVSYTHELTYNGMKRFVTTIVEDVDRKSIETVNLAFDSGTGILTGSTVMNLYTIQGTDKAYQKTFIPPMSMGTTNIFGTVDIEGNAIGETSEETSEETPEE